jgi:tetratricopeptide (TPR) repeat protein
LRRAYELVVRAVELDPSSPYALTAHGVALSEMAKGGMTSADEAKATRDAAEKCLRRALEIDPCIDSAWWSLAEVLERKGDDDGALAAYRETAKLNPFHSEAFLRLGALLARREDPAGALGAYCDAIARDPAHAVAACEAIDAILAAAPDGALDPAPVLRVLGETLADAELDAAAAAAVARTLRAAGERIRR